MKTQTDIERLKERLEDSTELLRSFVGSHADEYGQVTTQVAENELTIREIFDL